MLTRNTKDSILKQRDRQTGILGLNLEHDKLKTEKSLKNRLLFSLHRKERKRKFKNKITPLFVIMIAILIVGVSFVIDTNIIVAGTQKFLNGLGIYTQEVTNVEITSSDYDEQGSWHVDKSAKWIGSGKAQVIFDVNSVMKTGDNYKDVILVLDISGSMDGEKMDKAKSDSKELVEYLLSNTQNRVAIITFESTSTIISPFSNNKDELLEKIDAITTTGCTNYNSALLNVDIVMDGYVKETNRDVVTLFLTDGYPNEDTPNQLGAYEVLKDKYPYMTVNGVQYEMGTEIIEEIKQITDSQWVADQSTLNNVLFDASVSPVVYESFVVTDYIYDDYFYINSVDDIKVSIGTVKLEDEDGLQKIVWDLGTNSFMTGGNAKMYIDLSLKEQYLEDESFYPTNEKEIINSKLPLEDAQEINSTLTPVLKNAYEVIYDPNTPDGCVIDSIESETHYVSQNVTKKTDALTCDGYLFKGWEIDEEDEQDIQRVNDDVFVMPGHDVKVRATWTRQSVVKSMDGTVHENTTLYKVLQNEATSGGLAKEYTSTHQDSIAGTGTQKIYYYYGSNSTNGTAILDKNNVIFADMCWQMIRTTDTGGVKMIYNGEPDVDGKCGTSRGTHVGYSGRTTQTLSSEYYYGTSYTYDSTAKTFSLDGEKTLAKWDDTTYSTLIGKYTCKATTEDGTCPTLYYVESYYSSTKAYVLSINSSSNYSQFGTMPFNANYNSPAYVGYMYGDVYSYSTTTGTTTQSFTSTQTMLSPISLSLNYWYSDDVAYGTPTANKYNLVEPYQVTATTDYPNLVGKYTFRNSTESYTYSSVYYIAAVNNTTMYYKQLSGGNLLSAYEPIVFGDSITSNDDGTYTLNNTQSVALKDWYANYATYNNMYTCNDSSVTCENPRYVTTTSTTNYTYLNASDTILIAKGRNGLELTDTLIVRKDELVTNSSNYSDYKYTCNTTDSTCTESNLRMISAFSTTGYTYAPNRYFGSSVTYDGTEYTLVDPIEIENYNNLTNLSTHHYICVTIGQKKCATVAYVYYYTGSGTMYYITLKDGVLSVDVALDKMLNNNTTNSTMKNAVDAWYERYLIDYTDYLEDTIFCNDRSIRALNGWNPNGGSTNSYLQFKEYSVTSDLYCTNETDRFSVSNEKAKLTYPVGLMSSPEMKLLNNSNARKTGQYYWLSSPRYFSYNYAYGRHVSTSVIDDLGYYGVTSTYGVRPAVSLAPGTEYSGGDGSMDAPYIVDLRS